MPTLHPNSDATAARRNAQKVLETKGEAKAALQEELGWPEERKIPLLCLPAGMTDQLGGKLLQELI
ncbi:hypothetical protein HZA45_00410, partial [Candidatus Peregrinibacteria bacterium]|nr:hypothetical protein [Candidatus Peregrinibacteria bacterium]